MPVIPASVIRRDSFRDTGLDFLLRRVYQAEAVVASMRGKDNHWMALELMSRPIAWGLTPEEPKGKLR